MNAELIADGDVEIWRFGFGQDVGAFAARLPADERARGARFIAERHRAAFAVQRVVLRLVLARYLARDPWTIRFAIGERGKPGVVDGGDLEFNLSHADDAALIAVARGFAVGVDIERLAADIDPMLLGPRVLAPDERAARVDIRAFLRVWCRKEACLKATGDGLLDDLTAVSVVADRVAVGPARVVVTDVGVGAAHVAALATTRPIAPLRAVQRAVTW